MANAQRPHSTPLPTAVRWVHAILEPRLLPGDLVVDATAGNGHDTLFLAQRVLPEDRSSPSTFRLTRSSRQRSGCVKRAWT